MLYAIIAEDIPGTLNNRMEARAAHLARLEELDQNGRLVLAGPHPLADQNTTEPAGFSGSLVVAEFESLAIAQEWAGQDPYVAAGVYGNVTVKPFKQVFPK